MDAHRFDALARACSVAGSRRRTLAALLGSALGLLAVGPAISDEVSARKRHKRKDRKDQGGKRRKKVKVEGPCGNGKPKKNRCKRDRQCCTNYCKKRRCRCRKAGQSCTEDRNCCPERTGRTCVEGSCQAQTCLAQGAACPGELPCCAGLSCQDATCQPPCAETCQAGCCAGNDCKAGDTTEFCGSDGETCQTCEPGLQCLQSICDCGTGTVCAVGCPYPTLQAAIADPDGPHDIELCATTFPGPFTISRNLTITGAGDGEDSTILDGQGGGSTVTVNAGVVAELHGLRIIGGSGDGSHDGGGIHNNGALVLMACTMTDNHVIDDGGGIYNGGSAELALYNCTVTDNTAGDGGGIGNRGLCDLSDSEVSFNEAERDGGGIYNLNTGTLLLADTTVTDNTADDAGGGIFSTGTVNYLGDTCFENNDPQNCIGADPCPSC